MAEIECIDSSKVPAALTTGKKYVLVKQGVRDGMAKALVVDNFGGQQWFPIHWFKARDVFEAAGKELGDHLEKMDAKGLDAFGMPKTEDNGPAKTEFMVQEEDAPDPMPGANAPGTYDPPAPEKIADITPSTKDIVVIPRPVFNALLDIVAYSGDALPQAYVDLTVWAARIQYQLMKKPHA